MIAAERGLESSNQETVVAAGHASGNGPRSKTADTVGDEPLACFGLGQIAADFPAESDFR
jgi:hypothetical protein